MTLMKTCIGLTAVAAVVAAAACTKGAVTNDAASGNNGSALAQSNSAGATDPIASAESAAPASIAHDATIMMADASGAMKTLRQGHNGCQQHAQPSSKKATQQTLHTKSPETAIAAQS